jgi:ammonia channel protein AmtB
VAALTTTAELKVGADTAWTILTAFLVFFMNAVGVFSFGSSFVVWRLLDRLMGLRVSAAHEELGLDASEMGVEVPESAQG